jgi:acyl-CoA synthetase (AMP-forming)/AMP-acid ligase II
MLVDTFTIQPDEIDLPAFPLYALIDLLIGVTSVIPDISFPAPGKVNPALTLLAIQEHGVTNLFASPVMLDRLATYGLDYNIKLTCLKRVITAGAPAPIQVQEKFLKLLPENAHLFGIYGATETLPISIIESREILEDTRYKSAQGAGVCIGRPVDGANVRIIQICDEPIPHWDESIELPADQIGEITVIGKAVTKEYVAREDANRFTKILDGDEIVHRMGDVGYFDLQGRLWYCGRKSHRVVVGKETYFTECIEGIFNAHPLVYRTALVGVNGTPVLWVELETQAKKADKTRIKQELFELGASHPQASKIETMLFVNQFPTDVRHNSKIIREKLTQMAERKSAQFA